MCVRRNNLPRGPCSSPILALPILSQTHSRTDRRPSRRHPAPAARAQRFPLTAPAWTEIGQKSHTGPPGIPPPPRPAPTPARPLLRGAPPGRGGGTTAARSPPPALQLPRRRLRHRPGCGSGDVGSLLPTATLPPPGPVRDGPGKPKPAGGAAAGVCLRAGQVRPAPEGRERAGAAPHAAASEATMGRGEAPRRRRPPAASAGNGAASPAELRRGAELRGAEPR